MKRPEFIKHYSEFQEASHYYPGSKEPMGPSSPFGKAFGLTRLGIHHQILEPGMRSSWPHAESTEEEFVYVISGNPDVWVDGHLHRLNPGDGVGFPPGTGISHAFLNNTDSQVQLLVVGDTNRADNKCAYPLDEKRNAEIKHFYWADMPKRELGPHDGLPDRLRESEIR
jgi:uncharacterized cupin superfamily protein